jgi:plastocyanin/mono/diheme cytochrome c family protein
VKYLIGVVATLIAEAVVVALVIVTGVMGVSTNSQPEIVDRVLAYASTRSIRHHAKEVKNPRANDPQAVKEGLVHYRAMCTPCHGGPGAEPEEFSGGLHPEAPDLSSDAVQSFTDGMLFDTIAGGIGSTGMPEFGSSHSREEIWAIVAFVRHLNAMTPEEKKALGEKPPPEPEDEGGGEGEQAPPPAPTPAPTPAPPAPEGHPAVHKVTIANSRFNPATIEIHAGDTIEWVNTDFIAHTATAKDHSFDTRQIDGDQTKRVTLKKKGTFPYYCRYHNGMQGTVIVR